MKRKAKVLPSSNEWSVEDPVVPLSDGSHEDVPVVKWKAKVPPSNGSPEDIPVVKWKAKVPPSDEDVPVVKWKAKVPPSDGSSEDIPVVKWKAKVPPSDGSSEDIPVVKWKAKVPPSDGSSEDIPVVKWKAKVPPSDGSSEDIPVVKWKAKVPPSDGSPEDVPVVKWKAKVPPSDGSPEDVPVVKWKAKVPPSNGSPEDVPVVKWKAKVPPSNGSPEDVPVVKWKAKVPPSDGSPEDVPVVKWKAKVPPSDGSPEDVPVVKWKAKVPPSNGSPEDVPVVKWKAKVPPSDGSPEDVPVVKWKAKVPPSNGSPEDVPVVKWKAKVPESKPLNRNSSSPESSDSERFRSKGPTGTTEAIPVVKWKKAKVPPESSPQSNGRLANQKTRNTAKSGSESAAGIPVVKWKDRIPTEPESTTRKSSSPESSDALKTNSRMKSPAAKGSMLKVKKAGLKVPAGPRQKSASPERSEVPVVKWKVKMPDSQVHEDKSIKNPSSSTGKGKTKGTPQQHVSRLTQENLNHHAAGSPSQDREEQFQRSSRSRKSRGRIPATNSHSDMPPEVSRVSHSSSHQSNSSLSSESFSPARQISTDDLTQKTHSRRSSFSDSRSPSPPSIAPHIRMAIGSPVSRRRTPSPARMSASLNRQSPNHSPALQQKHFQLLMKNHQSLPGSSSSPGIPSPGLKIRNPHSPASSVPSSGGGSIKGGAPIRGLTPPNSDKKRRLLPASPDVPGNSRLQEVVRRGGLQDQKTASPR